MLKKFHFRYLIPPLFSLLVWLPLAFLAGGSLMSGLELTGHLAPILMEKKGFATWSLLPSFPTLKGYVELLLDSPEFFVFFWNSVKMSAGVLLGQTVTATLGAWWFSQNRSAFGKGLFTTYIVLMLMPFQVMSVSHYLVLHKLNLLNTLWAVVLPAMFTTFPVFIIYRFFQSIPPSILEAARMDGANQFQIFWHIGLPLGKSGIASALVLGFIECWNMMEQPMTFLEDKSLWPLSLYLPGITSSTAGVALAASVLVLTPSILVFLYGQSYLEQGIAGTGLKE